MKKCSSCKELLPAEKFNKCKAKKDGLSTYCKECNKKAHKDHYSKNKESYIEKNKDRRSNIKSFIEEIKHIAVCCRCPENDIACLDFHHKDQNKDFNIASAINRGMSLERLKKEIDKCIVICSNCHRKLHYYNK